MAETSSCEVLVIGAGPAGSAAAAILAEGGHDVLILERETFPRYRVGESLIPYCWFPLERLGVLPALEDAPFVVPKHSVQFVNTDGRLSTPFYFHQHSDHPSSRTWQVDRAAFDAMLLDNAREKGARVLKGVAREFLQETGAPAGVQAVDPAGEPFEITARVCVDASGREAFSQSRNRWRIDDERLRKLALWTYYEGAVRDEGLDAGATTIAYLPEKGWFWYIPLPDNRVGVGAVAERDYLFRDTHDPDAIFEREAALQPWIAEHLAPGKRLEPCRITGDFSYRSRHCAADGLVLAGDAFAFLDPVFSSGVFLALESGVLAGDAVAAALARNDTSAASFADYGDRFRTGLEAMRRLVHAFYDATFNFGEFLRAHPELRGELTDCLIGNVYRDLEPLFAAVGEFAEIPPPLPHGAPLSRG